MFSSPFIKYKRILSRHSIPMFSRRPSASAAAKWIRLGPFEVETQSGFVAVLVEVGNFQLAAGNDAPWSKGRTSKSPGRREQRLARRQGEELAGAEAESARLTPRS
jgi:hypothetical protein